MKKFLFLLAFLLGPWKPAFAVDMDVWLSSNTATADTTQPICGQYIVGTSTAVYHAAIHEVIVSSPSAGGVTLYNSSWTTTGTQTMGPFSTGGVTQTTVSPYTIDVIFPNGFMYTKMGTAQVQIEYQCY